MPPFALNSCRTEFAVRDYNLEATLASGQAFRWRQEPEGWEGVVSARWVRLQARTRAIVAETAQPPEDWEWLARYLQVAVDLKAVLAALPSDPCLQAAVQTCRGLRLLKQDPWECLASFILSSNKQIVQIEQVVARLCERWGEAVAVPSGHRPRFAFPCAQRLAERTEGELRACKMGFRAPYLLETARRVAAGVADLELIGQMPVHQARLELMKLPGVGRKIADCVLLFGFGFGEAFPIDVWMARALRRFYFPEREPGLKRLQEFAEAHFGPGAGYAQQYLFHFMRVGEASRQ
jgi:N-glycosylase/DNA lyase